MGRDWHHRDWCPSRAFRTEAGASSIILTSSHVATGADGTHRGIEAVGCGFIVSGIDELLGASNAHFALDLLAKLSLLVVAAAFLVVFTTGVADNLRRIQHKPRDEANGNTPG